MYLVRLCFDSDCTWLFEVKEAIIADYIRYAITDASVINERNAASLNTISINNDVTNYYFEIQISKCKINEHVADIFKCFIVDIFHCSLIYLFENLIFIERRKSDSFYVVWYVKRCFKLNDE